MLVRDISSKTTTRGDRDAPTRRIWSLQYGPCWCRGVPGHADSFDLIRTGAPKPIPGRFGHNIVLISERVIEGSRSAVLDLVARVPDPKVVISVAICPATAGFWDALPGGWGSLNEIVDVDVRVGDCPSGRPEALLAAVLGQVEYLDSVGTQNVERDHYSGELSLQ